LANTGTSGTAAQRRLRPIPSPADPGAAPREFPVRFAPTTGLSALVRKPSNSFGWVGPGTLCFDDQGVHVSAKRLTLLGLQRARVIIQPTEIHDVYREGNTVQVDLRGGTRRRFFRFWAPSTAAAAEIVRLLPTKRTIELETTSPDRHSPGASRRSASWQLPLAATLTIALAWFGTTRLLHTPERSRLVTGPADSARRAATDASNVQSLQVQQALQKFGERFDALTTEFATAFEALQAGSISQREFADGLEAWLLPQWETLGNQLTSDRSVTARTGANGELRAIVDNWERALAAYAHGLRTGDPREVLGAFAYMRQAETHQARARAMLQNLERTQPASAVTPDPLMH
jgi:hypothetical protein